MNFIEAFQSMQEGNRLTRLKWQKKATVYIVENKMNNISHVEVRTLGSCIMYAASSEDLLANDWEFAVEPTIKQQKQEAIVL